jgi:hypothetical protein
LHSGRPDQYAWCPLFGWDCGGWRGQLRGLRKSDSARAAAVTASPQLQVLLQLSEPHSASATSFLYLVYLLTLACRPADKSILLTLTVFPALYTVLKPTTSCTFTTLTGLATHAADASTVTTYLLPRKLSGIGPITSVCSSSRSCRDGCEVPVCCSDTLHTTHLPIMLPAA